VREQVLDVPAQGGQLALGHGYAFRDDEGRIRTENAPANFTTIKHIATNLLRLPSTKDSLRSRRKIAAWDDGFVASLIAA